MSVKIEQPYPVFRDKIGLPLDGGLIYIGVAGLNPEINPIQCYFDEDFTLVAPQPLRTINGYISRNGSPANIFLKVTGCSITVKNKSKITQYTDLNFQLSNFGSLTASQIFDESGLTQQQINLAQQQINEINFPLINVRMYGVKGDGSSGDQQKISEAYEYLNSIGGGTLYLPDGVYLIDTVNYADEGVEGGLKEQYAFPVYSNIKVLGQSKENTIFKMADGIIYKDLSRANLGCALFADAHKKLNIENFSLENFKVNMNGINNPVVNLPTTGTDGVQQAVFPVLYYFDYYNAKNITVDNIWVHQNSGMNSIYLGHKTSNCTIRNCLFTDHSDYIEGNDLIKDHSTVYIAGLNNTVHDNKFIMTHDPITINPPTKVSWISTAIEAHGVNTLVSNNLVDGYGAPFLAASTEWYNGESIKFSGNKAYNAGIGFAYNSYRGQLRADFMGNTVYLRKDKSLKTDNFIRYVHGAIESGAGVNSIQEVDKAYSEIIVTNNYFEQLEPDDWDDGDRFINICHSIKEAKLYVAKGNTFKNFKGSLYYCNYHRDFLNAQHIINDNTYINCGYDSSYTKYNSAYTLADIPFVTENGISYNNLKSINISSETLISCKYGVLLARRGELIANKITFSNGVINCNSFIPPYLSNNPLDLVSGSSIDISYESTGVVLSGQDLTNQMGVSLAINMRDWSSNVDDNLLNTLSYIKERYYLPKMILRSPSLPTLSKQGAFNNSDGDRIISISPALNQYSSYVFNSGRWYGLDKVVAGNIIP
jgi:hypothetical protein